ncbi:hypothetical protein FQA47_016464 [Oryzias melastigma]|uniref:Uncharacterized protein n=1 Tax=Oryzias melastigma TaxID=30732 RepID=A0A834CEX4_ORYME|nr:hypothetical protein FQA47_016464 [Oryzias melastigma]
MSSCYWTPPYLLCGGITSDFCLFQPYVLFVGGAELGLVYVGIKCENDWLKQTCMNSAPGTRDGRSTTFQHLNKLDPFRPGRVDRRRFRWGVRGEQQLRQCQIQ